MSKFLSRLSRRDFLKLSGVVSVGALAGGRLLTACDQNPDGLDVPASQLPAETVTSVQDVIATDTPFLPTEAPTSSATATEPAASMATTTPTITSAQRSIPPKPAVIQHFPAVTTSKVMHTHHTGVRSGDALVPNALRQMLDESITGLTGLNDAREAWAAIFQPDERIGIKVNAFRNSLIWTHVPLVTAVTDSLQDAGIPAENIIVFDYFNSELDEAGYLLNVDGPGVRVYGNDEKDYDPVQTQLPNGKGIRLSNVLKDCDALINMPVLKSHMLSGLTFALKNHYGSFHNPGALHGRQMLDIAELNALPDIKDRARLFIGDALSANLRYASSYPYWSEDWVGDSIFMSFDPVAHDTLALQLLSQALEADGGNATGTNSRANPYLKYAAELELGTNEQDNMDVVETRL